MGARFFTAQLIVFSLTVAVLGCGGYAVTCIAVPPPRELFGAAAFDFELAPGWWCELDGAEYTRQTSVFGNYHHGHERAQPGGQSGGR